MRYHDQYDDRNQAAMLLAEQLEEYRGRNPLILAIPRGAVPMGKILADHLEGELDVVLVHKFGAAFDPEFALGAVDEHGWTHLMPYAQAYGAGNTTIEQEKARQVEMLKKRREQYTPYRAPADPKGRIAIVVDDGIATGATMIAALHSVRAREPAELVCAAPVIARQSVNTLQSLADKLVFLQAPSDMMSVGRFYRDFRQVEDEDVIRILAQAGAGKSHDGFA